MLVKRPILLTEKNVLFGFNEKEYEESLWKIYVTGWLKVKLKLYNKNTVPERGGAAYAAEAD